MKKLFAGAVLALAISGTAVAVSAAPAAADACPRGATCGYTATNWVGTAYDVYADNRDLTMFAGFRYAESIYNNGASCNVYIYSERNHQGARYPLNRGTGWRSLAGSAIKDHAFSNKWFGCS
jgi:Peptidase inhibitor family I36